MTNQIRWAAAIAAVLVCACGPVGPIPGGELKGELVTQPVDDWSFSDDFRNIQLETGPEDDPVSVTLWCAAHGGSIYIVSARGDESRWAKNLLDQPRSRLRIDGKLYPRRAVRVSERAEIDQVLDTFVAKYDFDLPDEEERARGLMFRLESPLN